MDRRLEAPNLADLDRIARQFIQANDMVTQLTGNALSGGTADLALIQQVLDAKIVEPEATYALHALGIAFARIFLKHHDGYDWWMVEDEDGRDPALRYRQTTLLVFPQSLISNRVEDGAAIDMRALYDGLSRQLEELLEENYPEL